GDGGGRGDPGRGGSHGADPDLQRAGEASEICEETKMTCRECELLLADGLPGAESHLAGCRDCRALAEELGANAVALAAMRDDAIPVRGRRPRWVWATAAAAAAVLAVGLVAWKDRPRLAVPDQAPPVEVAAIDPLPMQAPTV